MNMNRKQIVPWIVPILFLVSWQLSSQFGLLSSRVLPNPVDVFKSAVELTRSGQLFEYISASSKRAFIGFIIGGVIGFGLGLLNGLSRFSESLLDSSLQMIRN